MKIILTFLSLVSVLSVSAQIEPDMIPAKHTDIKIQPIGHGSVILEWNGELIYVDPFGAEKYEGQKDPTMILITDIHGDHLNVKTLEAINTSNAKFVVPQAVKDQLPEAYHKNLFTLANGEARKVNDISISAIPMYNLPETDDSRHPKGRGNGYILNLGGKKVYLSGDTEDIEEMRALEGIDVAFVCMNLPYTMDIDQAASGVLAFKPAIVYPYHYRGQGGLSDVEQFKKIVNEGDASIEVRLKNWYPE